MLTRMLAVLVVLPVLAFQEGDLKSGPAIGQDLPGSFHPHNVTGAHAGNPHCLVCEYGLNPSVAVFARTLPEANSPLALLLQKLDQSIAKNRRYSVGGFAVFLAADIDKEATRVDLARRVDELGKGLDLKNVVLTLYPAEGPDKYNIHPDADVTILVYRKLKVVSNHSFRKDKLSAKDVDSVLASLAKASGGS